jgi:SAM-dependent methyltransferase
MAEIDARLAAHYDRYYDGTSEWRELGARAKVANVLALWERAGRSPGGRVADIGCGEGSVAEGLVGAGFEVDGFDLSLSAVEAATSRPGRRATYADFDGSRLPSDDDSYDLAVLSHVVEHLEHPRVLLREAARVADLVYVEVPLELTLRTPAHFTWTDLGHINIYNATTFRHLVESVGLRIVAEATFDHPYRVTRYGRARAQAVLRWSLRRLAHRASPRLAAGVFVYHHGLLAET